MKSIEIQGKNNIKKITGQEQKRNIIEINNINSLDYKKELEIVNNLYLNNQINTEYYKEYSFIKSEIQKKISNYKSGENVLDHIFLGGGGTDFRPVFQYAESIEPNLVIYFTDGDGVIPTDNYQFDTIWMIINDNKMPFGNVINMI